MITLDDFRAKYAGKSVLYDDVEADRGQCVQLFELYLVEVLGVTPPLYDGAADYWEKGIDGFEKIPASSGYPIKGDIVVWDRDQPGSGRYGHIDICFVDGNGGGFLGFDTNWAGKTAHDVQHDYSYVSGYLRKGEDMYQGQTAQQWHDQLASANGVADARLRNESKLWTAEGVNPAYVKDEDAATTQAIANADAKNKVIEGLKAQLDKAQVVIDPKTQAQIDQIVTTTQSTNTIVQWIKDFLSTIKFTLKKK